MTTTRTPSIFIAIAAAILLLSSYSVPTNSSQEFSSRLSREDAARLGLTKRPQKRTHLHFFFHDIVSGSNPTSLIVVKASAANSATGFGAVVIADDALTVGPELSSKTVGRAQGIFALSDQREIGMALAINFVFAEGEFNGSTLSVVGRNEVMQKVRELPVVGGTGVFRFARGYAEARTHQVNFTSLNAVVEYDIYVLH